MFSVEGRLAAIGGDQNRRNYKGLRALLIHPLIAATIKKQRKATYDHAREKLRNTLSSNTCAHQSSCRQA
jgi:hypothetical protein